MTTNTQTNRSDSELIIKDVKAYPTSFPIPPGDSVQLGMGRAVKKDAVVVKVTTEGGLVGYGECHHGKAHTAVAQLVNTTLRQLVVGMDAVDVVGVWHNIYSKQLASHRVGAGCSMAMSGIDMALWDIRGKAVGWPLYKLLGGRNAHTSLRWRRVARLSGSNGWWTRRGRMWKPATRRSSCASATPSLDVIECAPCARPSATTS